MNETETIQITRDNLDKLKFTAEGLIPAIAQDHKTGEVLMMAWMNLDSLKDTIKNGKASYWSRSRKSYWVKGETSGHFQFVKEIFLRGFQQCLNICSTSNFCCFEFSQKLLNFL